MPETSSRSRAAGVPGSSAATGTTRVHVRSVAPRRSASNRSGRVSWHVSTQAKGARALHSSFPLR